MQFERWTKKTLGEVTSWLSGGTPSKVEPAFWGGSIPWISASSMKTSRLADSAERITQAGLENGSRLVQANTILLLVRGSELHKRVPIGITTQPVAFNQDVKALIPHKGVDAQFLFYWLLSQRDSLLQKVEDTGIGAGKLDTKVVMSLPILLPNPAEQKLIASFFKTIDAKIELNQRMNETLDGIGRAIFKSLFVDFNQAPGTGNRAHPLSPRSTRSKIGFIPSGWRAGTIRDCCTRIENGGTPLKSETGYWRPAVVPWLTSGEVRQKIVFETENRISEIGLLNSSAKLWPAGTTVVAMYGATAGQTTYLAEEMSANQACCGLVPKDNFGFYIYLHLSKSMAGLANMARGSAQQNLSQQLIADFPIIIPSEDVLCAFNSLCDSLFQQWIHNLRNSRSLTALRDQLLPRLVSGEIHIKQAEKPMEARV